MSWPEALVLSVALVVAFPIIAMVAIAILMVVAEMANKPKEKKKDPRVQ